MKLIDKDALVAEIERKLEYNQRRADIDLSSSKVGRAKEDKDILSFINTLEVKEVDLEKEPASEDFEQAAESAVLSVFTGYADTNTPFRAEKIALVSRIFKAGAQWDREQMMKDAISGVIFGSRYFRQKNISLTNLSEEQYDKLKDFGEKVKVIIIKE